MSRVYGVPPKDFLMEGCVDEEGKRAEVEAIKKALASGADRRSPVFVWMLENYVTFSAMLSDKRPNWKRLAEVFSDLGLGEVDQPLAAETVRNHWWRVRRMKQGVKPKRRQKSKPEVAVLPVGTVRVHAPAPAAPRPAPVPTLPAPVAPVSAESSGALSDDAEQKARAQEAQARMIAEMDKRSGR